MDDLSDLTIAHLFIQLLMLHCPGLMYTSNLVQVLNCSVGVGAQD